MYELVVSLVRGLPHDATHIYTAIPRYPGTIHGRSDTIASARMHADWYGTTQLHHSCISCVNNTTNIKVPNLTVKY